jgi:hypothetical protein
VRYCYCVLVVVACRSGEVYAVFLRSSCSRTIKYLVALSIAQHYTSTVWTSGNKQQ